MLILVWLRYVLVVVVLKYPSDMFDHSNPPSIVFQTPPPVVSQEQKYAVRTLFTKKLKDYISKDKIHFWI